MIVRGRVDGHAKAKTAFRMAETWYMLGPGIDLPDRFDVITFEATQATQATQGAKDLWYMMKQHKVIEETK